MAADMWQIPIKWGFGAKRGFLLSLRTLLWDDRRWLYGVAEEFSFRGLTKKEISDIMGLGKKSGDRSALTEKEMRRCRKGQGVSNADVLGV